MPADTPERPQPTCECCDDAPATHRDREGIPFCDGCWAQLLYEWSQVADLLVGIVNG